MSMSVAVTENCMQLKISTNKEKEKDSNLNKKSTTTKEKQKPDKSEYKTFFYELDGLLCKLGYLRSRDNSVKETETVKQTQKTGNGDFYTRLKNIYNQPLTEVKKNGRSTGERRLNKNDVNTQLSKNNADRQKNYHRTNKNICLKRVRKAEVTCDDLEGSEPPQDRSYMGCRVRLPPGRCAVPAREDLPDDEEGFSELIQSYISQGSEPANRREKELPGSDRPEARCSCSDVVSFTGAHTLNDIDRKLKKLNVNHRVATVIIKTKKLNSKVDEEADTRAKAKFSKETPALLTKFCLESICEQVGAHPALRSLSVERVPLSQPCQAMLVPSFATLKELRLISTRLGDDGVSRLCRYIWRSTCLTNLDLAGNGIGPQGVEHVVRMLERKAALRSLEIQYSCLERLSLARNPIGEIGLCGLLNTVGKELWLQSLDVRDCGLRQKEAVRLAADRLDLQDLRAGGKSALREVLL